MMHRTALISDQHLRQFREDGFCVLHDAIAASLLELLRAECAHFVAREDAKMDALGVDVLDITHRNKRYHASFCIRDRPVLGTIVFGNLMEAICRALLGPDAFLFYDQFVVKGADTGMKLAWHQDSGYVNAVDGDLSHRPYITCWCPLDDVSEENGTVFLLPAGQSGIRAAVPHRYDPASNDWVGYDGPLNGVPIRAKAGTVVVFSSVSMHRSGANRTSRPRRAYLAQYSPEPVLTADHQLLWGNALPFLKGGRRAVGSPMPDKPMRIDFLVHAGQKLQSDTNSLVERTRLN